MSRNNCSLFMQKVILDGMKIDAGRMLQFFFEEMGILSNRQKIIDI